jgi:phage gp36-like protein
MYCLIEDIQKQLSQDTLIQLTDDNQTGKIDSVIAEEAILYSESLINGYLRGRYTLPLISITSPNPPDVLKILAVDLSIYRLYSRRFQADIPGSISEKYKNSIKILEQIQRGIISLGVETAGTAPELGEYRTNKSFQDRTFSKQVLNEY